VPTEELAKAPLERLNVQRAPDADRRRDIVDWIPGLELVEKPESLLGEGEGKVFSPGDPAQRRYRGRLTGMSAGRDEISQLRDGRRVEQTAECQLDSEGNAQPRDHPRREQGVPTELEKIVVDTDLCDAQDLLPEFGNASFSLCPRGDVGRRAPTRPPGGFNKGRTIDLARSRAGHLGYLPKLAEAGCMEPVAHFDGG
jgi:hypothetical protein